jgi:hypothetical protein
MLGVQGHGCAARSGDAVAGHVYSRYRENGSREAILERRMAGRRGEAPNGPQDEQVISGRLDSKVQQRSEETHRRDGEGGASATSMATVRMAGDGSQATSICRY